jgi:hypothetical protein
MRKRVCCAALLLLCAGSLRAQAILPERGQERSIHQHVFGLGVDLGWANGVGLTFRHHLPSPFSYQVTGGIIKVDDHLSYAYGAQGQFDITRGPVSRFYAAMALGYYYSGKSGGDNDLKGPGRLGLGIGIELPLAAGFHANGELLFTYFTDGTVLPLPQVGLHYYFY